ncbi:MAG: FhaA domain-containing protein [Chloroflexota bacterium]|nr:FhaA domain-containing protein [Chloroflexota bacterium]
MKGLAYLEGWIEQLVEEPFVRLFAGSLLPQDVATHLVQAMEEGERQRADGTWEDPTHYQIALHPQTLEHLQTNHPHLESELTTALTMLVRHLNLRPTQPPQIELRPDVTVPPHDVRITTDAPAQSEEERTRELDLSRVKQPQEQIPLSPSAYLLLPGGQHFELTQPHVRIGRALDNDLILEDSRVSRHHARLQQEQGEHRIQDLSSSGGTTLNGAPVREGRLQAGDRIALSEVELHYIRPEKNHSTRGR